MTLIFSRKKKRNKKGNAIIETLTFFVIIFILAIVWIISTKVQRDLNDDIQADDIDADSKQLNQDLTDRAPNVLDAMILFFLIIFWALALLASYLVDTHPAFFVLSMLLLVFVFVVVIFLGNAFEEIFTEDITGQSAYFPYTFFIFNNLLIIAIVMGSSILLVMFAKFR